jgi:hypothetical protein
MKQTHTKKPVCPRTSDSVSPPAVPSPVLLDLPAPRPTNQNAGMAGMQSSRLSQMQSRLKDWEWHGWKIWNFQNRSDSYFNRKFKLFYQMLPRKFRKFRHVGLTVYMAPERVEAKIWSCIIGLHKTTLSQGLSPGKTRRQRVEVGISTSSLQVRKQTQKVLLQGHKWVGWGHDRDLVLHREAWAPWTTHWLLHYWGSAYINSGKHGPWCIGPTARGTAPHPNIQAGTESRSSWVPCLEQSYGRDEDSVSQLLAAYNETNIYSHAVGLWVG